MNPKLAFMCIPTQVTAEGSDTARCMLRKLRWTRPTGTKSQKPADFCPKDKGEELLLGKEGMSWRARVPPKQRHGHWPRGAKRLQLSMRRRGRRR